MKRILFPLLCPLLLVACNSTPQVDYARCDEDRRDIAARDCNGDINNCGTAKQRFESCLVGFLGNYARVQHSDEYTAFVNRHNADSKILIGTTGGYVYIAAYPLSNYLSGYSTAKRFVDSQLHSYQVAVDERTSDIRNGYSTVGGGEDKVADRIIQEIEVTEAELQKLITIGEQYLALPASDTAYAKLDLAKAQTYVNAALQDKEELTSALNTLREDNQKQYPASLNEVVQGYRDLQGTLSNDFRAKFGAEKALARKQYNDAQMMQTPKAQKQPTKSASQKVVAGGVAVGSSAGEWRVKAGSLFCAKESQFTEQMQWLAQGHKEYAPGCLASAVDIGVVVLDMNLMSPSKVRSISNGMIMWIDNSNLSRQ